VGVDIKAYAEGIVDGRRIARAAEDWRKAIEHERSLGLHWHDRLNIQNSQASDRARRSALIEPAHAPVSSKGQNPISLTGFDVCGHSFR
jgi:hypothetical protein